MTENWKPVVGYEGLYEVSSLGAVRRLRYVGRCANKALAVPRVLKATPLRLGYLRVALSKDGGAKSFLVHRLVLTAFRGCSPAGTESGHLNGDRQDNRLENLAWVTSGENEFHKKLHGTYQTGSRSSNAKLTDDDVMRIRSIYRHAIAPDLAREYGISKQQIQKIVNGKYWKHLPFLAQADARSKGAG